MVYFIIIIIVIIIIIIIVINDFVRRNISVIWRWSATLLPFSCS